MSLFLVEERQMAEGLYNHEIEMADSDCNRGDDVANTLIQSALNNSSDESPCSSKYQFIQPILPPTLCISEIEGIKLSSHHNLLDLDLSNNKITKVDGLEALKRLKRLNLSFNHIARIEGLDSLQCLLWLSFYHNEITEATGLEKCIALQTLSLGENRIKCIEENIGPRLQHLRHLRDLNLKGNPCMLEYHNDTLDDPNHPSSHQQTIQGYLPSLVYFNDVKISKATIDDNNYIYMPHNKSYYNILNAFHDSESTGQLFFQLNPMYEKERNFDNQTFYDKLDSVRQNVEAMWTEYISKAYEQNMRLIRCIACHEKYLLDLEQDQLNLTSNVSDVDEIKIDCLIEQEISFGEKLRMKWIETSDLISNIESTLTLLQNHFHENVHTTIKNHADRDSWTTEEQNIFSNHITSLFHEGSMRRYTAIKALQELSDTWFCRHRARVIEISRMRS